MYCLRQTTYALPEAIQLGMKVFKANKFTFTHAYAEVVSKGQIKERTQRDAEAQR